MRARSALALALVLAAPLVLAAAPTRDDALRPHAAGLQLGAQLELVLGRVGASQPEARPGVLDAPRDAPRGSGATLVEVHWLAGERAWTTWLASRMGQPVDLDGDGEPELRVEVDASGSTVSLTIAGIAPARTAWAAWVERDGARWGLSGAGAPPEAAVVTLREGDLRVRVVAPSGSWHAAFAHAEGAKRTLAWLGAGAGAAELEASLGHGYHVRLPQGAAGGLRLLLADDLRAHDLTLRGLPAGALVARDADGPLRYRAPQPGGALAYQGDADAIGQRGDLDVKAEPLPPELTLAAEGDGFAVEASQPTDVLLDWRPVGGEGIRFVGNDVERVAVQPGASGGLVVAGPRGTVAVLRPGPGGDDGLGQVVDLGAQGALAVGAPSPLFPALVAVILGGAVVWAVRPGLRKV